MGVDETEAAYDRNVLLLMDGFNINECEDQLNRKIGFDKVINKEVILKIIQAIRSNYDLAFDAFNSKLDSLLSHLKEDDSIDENMRNFITSKIRSDKEAPEEDKVHLAIRNCKGYSLSLDVNHHLNN